MDFHRLDALRTSHPAWRLLRAEHGPLIASVLHRVFLKPNVRQMAEADLARHLDDDLFGLRRELGDEDGGFAIREFAAGDLELGRCGPVAGRAVVVDDPVREEAH